VLLRMTYLRGVNIGLFAYDFDQTWMAFFMDADLRIYCRYGSRDATSADAHNSAEGLLHSMKRVPAVHKEETANPKPAPMLPKLTKQSVNWPVFPARVCLYLKNIYDQ